MGATKNQGLSVIETTSEKPRLDATMVNGRRRGKSASAAAKSAGERVALVCCEI
jgi:hypothetical protein